MDNSSISITTQISFRLRSFISRHPLLYFSLLRLRGVDMTHAVNAQTEIAIVGHGGSGNSYATDAFKTCQPDKVIAHHLHRPAMVVSAVARNLPCLVLVRHPIDAISSTTSRISGPHFTLKSMAMALSDYANFHDSIIDLRDDFIVCGFREIVVDYQKVIDRVNKRFEKNYRVPKTGSDDSLRIIAQHKYPGNRRMHALDDIQEALNSPQLEKYRQRAERSYREFCEVTGISFEKDPPRKPAERNPNAERHMSV